MATQQVGQGLPTQGPQGPQGSQGPPAQQQAQEVPGGQGENQDKSSEDLVPVRDPSAPKKFLNGWTREIEHLFAEWADKASCYRWMHEKTGRMYQTRDQGFMFPIIILSTVGGAANFAMNSISNDPEIQKYVQLGLGGLSIATGILTTIANRLGYASSSEAHRGASISWGKFNRLIVIELSLHPDERMDAFAFMKMFRVELDRLIEQSPTIPEAIINNFIYEFKEEVDLKKPDITGNLRHTQVFSDSGTRLKKMAEDAALTLNLKKGVLKQLVMDDLDAKIRTVVKQMNKTSGATTPTNITIHGATHSTTPSGFASGFNSKEPVKHATSMVSTLTNATLPVVTGKTVAKNPIWPGHPTNDEDIRLEIPNAATKGAAESDK